MLEGVRRKGRALTFSDMGFLLRFPRHFSACPAIPARFERRIEQIIFPSLSRQPAPLGFIKKLSDVFFFQRDSPLFL
jgi:hypothetical protein